jgi:hypothetical protein
MRSLSFALSYKVMGVHCHQLRDTYGPPISTVVIRSRRMRWVGHVARLEESVHTCTVFMGSMKETDNFEVLGRDGRIVLK